MAVFLDQISLLLAVVPAAKCQELPGLERGLALVPELVRHAEDQEVARRLPNQPRDGSQSPTPPWVRGCRVPLVRVLEEAQVLVHLRRPARGRLQGHLW